ncbi:protein LTV1 homolog [Eurytemora carolleeae]|uniref:protein LTV1 homolog n=1 Tax=Eurytemora carolleeae TaxID=1294199 RepID=UPI000C789AD3|nr:protein LTV1 homolog [Eurytemora carolleeae]|eukprot:XP_023332626.1 protein LTV1 homolog [Eurytemora affinis]
MPKAANKKRAFIDKKNAVSFQLIHRSQQDPLAADEDAPQMILQRINKDKVKEEERKFGVFYEDDYNYLQHLKDRTKVEHDWEAADRFILERGERDSASTPEPSIKDAKTRVGETISLPRVVFPSNEEEEVGLLNKAAPRGLDLSLDPDVVAAMDDDFDYEDPENELDDDFILKAMGEGEDDDDDDDEGEEGSDQDWESDSDRMGGRSEDEDEDEVRKCLIYSS